MSGAWADGTIFWAFDLRGGTGYGSGAPSYTGYRSPAEVIAQCVWLYHRFPPSYREAEELLPARGVIVSQETVRQRCATFSPAYARGLRRRRARPGDTGDRDKVSVKINGEWQNLWRAVDHDGTVRDIPAHHHGGHAVPPEAADDAVRRAAGAGHRYARQVRGCPPAGHALGGAPPVDVSEQPSRERAPAHPPTQTCHARLPFPEQAQQFLAVFRAIAPHVRPRRHRRTAPEYRAEMTDRCTAWNQVTDLTTAA